MARPARKGLGYFPLDTDFLSDRKIRRLSQKFRSQGVITYIAALCEIYESRGYYVPFSTELCFDLSFTLQLEEQLVEQILIFCVEIRLFDRELLVRKGVLSSSGIQSRFQEICKRSACRIDPDLALFPTDDAPSDEDLSAPRTPPRKQEETAGTAGNPLPSDPTRRAQQNPKVNDPQTNTQTCANTRRQKVKESVSPGDAGSDPVDNSVLLMDKSENSVNKSKKYVDNSKLFVDNSKVCVDNFGISINKPGIPVDNFDLSTQKTRVSAIKTGVSATKTGVSVTKTRVSAAKTPLKGKGNKKEMKKDKKENEVNLEVYENSTSPSCDDRGEAARRAELLRMVLEATNGR